ISRPSRISNKGDNILDESGSAGENGSGGLPLVRPFRLLSLLEMKQLLAAGLLRIFDDLHDLEQYTSGFQGDDRPFREEAARSINSYLKHAVQMCRDIGLKTSLAQAERIERLLSGQAMSPKVLKDSLAELRSRVEDEISSMKFLYVERADLYDGTQ